MPQTPDEQLHCTYKSSGVFCYFEKNEANLIVDQDSLCAFFHTLFKLQNVASGKGSSNAP